MREQIAAREQAERELQNTVAGLEGQIRGRTADLTQANEALRSEIAERRQQEESLDLFRTLVGRSNDAMEVLDPKTGRFLDVNEKGCADLGYSREEFLSLKVFDIDPLVDPTTFEKIMEDLRQSGSKMWNGIHRRKDGSTFPVEVSLKYVRLERDYVVSVARDITERKRAEEALRESEQVSRSIIETANDAFVSMDERRVIRDWNRQAERTFGWARADVLGRPLHEIIIPERLRAAHLAGLKKLVETGVGPVLNQCIELSALRRDGTEFPVELTIWAVRASGGQQFFNAFVRDITERKRAEEMLAQRSRLAALGAEVGVALIQTGSLREILQHCTEAMVTHLDAAFARIWTLNETENMLELQASAGMYTHTDGPHGRVPVGQFKIGLIAQERKPHLTNSVVGDLRVNNQEWAKREGMVAFAGYPLLVEGRLVGVIAMFARHPLSDATLAALGSVADGIALGIERKRVEKSHTRLAMAVEQAIETIVVTDTAGKILYVNPAFEQASGYTRNEAIGQNPRVLKSGKHDAEFYRQMWAVLASGKAWTGHFINKRKDGTLFEEDATITPVLDPAGKIVNYVAVKRDITREVQLESQLRQAQKMESVGRLAGGVAHDFNNLLTAIIGYSDMTLKGLSASDPLRKHIEEVRAAGERATALTRQLLAFSRKQVLQPKVLDLNDLAANLSKMLHRLIGENILLTTTFDPTLGRVKADPGQIEQVITNLAVNARDAMPEGGTVTLQTANAELDEAYASEHAEVTPGHYVLLTVSDTGTGMTDEVKAHLFEPFFTTKGLGKGTGLGLATIYGIVKQSGGHITVYSEVGHGTTFKVYLPRVEGAAEVVASAKASKEVPRGTETILLVEDEEQVRKLARAVLEECGYTVLAAGSGSEALFLAKQHKGKLDLLLTDMIMPGINGRVLAKTLQPQNPTMRFIFMSGYTDTGILPKNLLAEGAAFLQKPFAVDTLTRKVRDVLDAPGPQPKSKS
ncbi:MAG: PAS domain S-box protein [Verrucomicrobia bacterium]|nr:PAS domain S-box protein [Verrucomicrobiota bacterium]